jgi:transcriptional regulator with XRE-family HTH domain
MGVWERFSARLREIREGRGLTQKQLAEQAGLTEQGLGQLERGRRDPSWETVCRLAQALGVDCSAFAEAPRTSQTVEKRAAGRPRKAEAGQQEPASPRKAERRPAGQPEGGKGKGKARSKRKES